MHFILEMTARIEIDALGKPCPMPLLLLKKQLKQNNLSQNYLLKASDPNSEIDITRYCQIHHYTCTIQKISSDEIHYCIEV
ncbi:sulfurtransferase TusA family protein [Acinetobacter shaoyimingii]|nr:sulfurtransferase TusA family protein [Acinetobacter shaoyimingii]